MPMSTFRLTPLCVVAEPIGLAMRRSTGDIYLDVQSFTGFMFIGASICNLFLRGWRIRKTEEETATKRRREHELEGRGERQSRLASNEPEILSRLGHCTLVFKSLFQLERV